jgi:hypothetical protein
LEAVKEAVVAGTANASKLSAARDKIEAAELVLESLINAESGLKASLGTASLRLASCKARLDSKVCQVVKSSDGVRRIIHDFYISRATFVEIFKLMRSLSRAKMLPPEAGHWEASVEWEGTVNAPLPEPWKGAVEALRKDAHASLPD